MPSTFQDDSSLNGEKLPRAVRELKMTNDHTANDSNELTGVPPARSGIDKPGRRLVQIPDGPSNVLATAESVPNLLRRERNQRPKPAIPQWLTEVICSKKTIQEKREAIDEAVVWDSSFLGWALLALYDLQEPDEKQAGRPLGRDGKGFCGWQGEVYMQIAQSFRRSGSLTVWEEDFLRTTNPKGRSRLGKHGRQLIALIQAASCPDRLKRKVRLLSGSDSLQERIA